MASKHQKYPKASSKKHSKVIIPIVIFVLLIATAVAAFFITKYFAERPGATNSSTSSPTDDTISGTPTAPDALAENAENKVRQIETNPQTPVQYDGENPNNADTLTGAVTFAGISEGELVINASIDQYLSGTCNFTLTNSSSVPITASAELIAGPTSAFCSYHGPIPAASGRWDITVKVTGIDNRTGTITDNMEL